MNRVCFPNVGTEKKFRGSDRERTDAVSKSWDTQPSYVTNRVLGRSTPKSIKQAVAYMLTQKLKDMGEGCDDGNFRGCG